MDRKKIKAVAVMMMLGIAITGKAQSGVTYNHDSAKKNQITVMETGSGSLSPTEYYQLLHSSYMKSAASKNKLGYRTTAGIGAYNQVEYAEAIDSALTKRAEIEALNMADRQVDLAWKVEGSKINSKMDAFKKNIDRILPVGGSIGDKQRWTEYYHIYETAIKATKDAYMPNAKRKKMYLQIYADVAKQNETLVKQLVQMSNANKTKELLTANGNYQTANKRSIISSASSKWREAGMTVRNDTSSGDDNNGPDDDDNELTVNR